MKFLFTKDMSSALVNQIKAEEVEYIFAKRLQAETTTLKIMKNRIKLMKERLKTRGRYNRSRIIAL